MLALGAVAVRGRQSHATRTSASFISLFSPYAVDAGRLVGPAWVIWMPRQRR